WMAPLAGITIPPVRKFFSDLGAGLTHTEMVSCSGLIRGHLKTSRMLDTYEDEGPVVLQLFAGDIHTLVRGAEMALSMGRFCALGINMACPMPKVLKKGAGSRLLSRPVLASGMVGELKKLGYPVWVKIRKITGTAMDTLRFCEQVLDSGADHVSIHGRTPSQRYEGSSDKALILEAADRFPGIISASGDIFTPEDVCFFLKGGCAGVLLARGALKDPFLFPRSLGKLQYRIPEEQADPTVDYQVGMLISLGDLIAEERHEKLAEVIVRRMLAGMFKGFPGISDLRKASAEARGWPELKLLLEKSSGYFERRDLNVF
ncbi:MAG TPA: tRNA-dihydrouridine synthase family protein, partial [Synergistales bacterium]|nr:tRNA-dihydrouridine synthase family protein [Synergistales bacterium]